MNKNDQKTIIITGATGGIGKALLEIFIKNDYYVIGTYNQNKEEADNLKQKYHQNIRFYQLDLSSSRSIEDFVQKIKEDNQSIDILVNNAGYVFDELLSDTSLEEVDKQISINLAGTIKLTKMLIESVKQRIINIGSQYAKEGHKYYVTYCASKWGIRGFTKALADEQKKLQVLTVNPGPTKTKMNDFWEQAVDPEEFAKVFYSELFEKNDYASGDDVDLYRILNKMFLPHEK